MPDTPQRRASDREPISSEPALVAVLDKREEAERRLEAYVANAQRDRKRQLYGFLFFIAVVVALFFQQREAMHRIEAEATIRAEELAEEAAERAEALAHQNALSNFRVCTEVNGVKTSIATFLRDAYMAGRDGISEGEQRILDIAETEFKTTSCPPEPGTS